MKKNLKTFKRRIMRRLDDPYFWNGWTAGCIACGVVCALIDLVFDIIKKRAA